jgi:L-arabinose transport system ATP-binding protein
MGENGAGKSTLIRVLSGDQAADTGTSVIDGEEQKYTSVRDAFHAGVIVIHQELQLVAGIDGRRKSLARTLSGQGRRHRQAHADRDCRAKKLDRHRHRCRSVNAKVASLSIGERQMVEIAKAVMLDARVIALDEPTSSLSSRESEILFSLIDRLKAKGTVILYVSHRLDEIFRLCDSLTVLRDGKLAAHHPDIAKRDARADHRRNGRTRNQPISGDWRGRPLGDTARGQEYRRPRASHPDQLFGAPKGEILGFFGLIGAGRSEMARLLYGADASASGQVTHRWRCGHAEQPRTADQRRHGALPGGSQA